MATASYERPRATKRKPKPQRGFVVRFILGFLGWIFSTTRFFVATTIFFILMSLFGYMIVGEYIRGSEIPAPNVIGHKLDDALVVAGNAHLTLSLDHREVHDTVPEGEIISQSPAPGARIKTGTPLTVVLSLGSPLITVPELKGKSKVVAGVLLRNAGLALGNLTEIPVSGLAGGIIQSSDPPAGSGLKQGHAVNLLLSAGAPQDALTMPDLHGMSLADARVVLAESGLRQAEEAKGPAAEGVLTGQIEKQDPAAGAPVSRTTPISVTYAGESAEGTTETTGESVNLTSGTQNSAAALGPGFSADGH